MSFISDETGFLKAVWGLPEPHWKTFRRGWMLFPLRQIFSSTKTLKFSLFFSVFFQKMQSFLFSSCKKTLFMESFRTDCYCQSHVSPSLASGSFLLPKWSPHLVMYVSHLLYFSHNPLQLFSAFCSAFQTESILSPQTHVHLLSELFRFFVLWWAVVQTILAQPSFYFVLLLLFLHHTMWALVFTN